MVSLTPHTRNKEATDAATNEGLINGLLTLIPSGGAVYFAMQNPGFVKRTNWQSRTALVIMPALFMFAFTSEHRLSEKMREIAQESRHSNETVQWAEQQLKVQQLQDKAVATKDTEKTLTDLYRQSVAQSGVSIVPGDTLGLHHRAANYAAEHPLKLLVSLAVPSVAAIFYGRTGKEHLQFSMKLLHTRVFGQFATLTLLMSVMGFKEYMDKNGKFITQAEAEARVDEMKRVRALLQQRLQVEREFQESAKKEIEKAQQEDLEDRLKSKL